MFSLKSLLFIVAVAAVGAAGLIYRSQAWISIVVGLSAGVLLLAGCRAWLAPQGRLFWRSFTLTGALYLAIVSLQPLRELHYNLPTTQLVTWGLEELQEAHAAKAATAVQSAAAGSTTTYYAPSASYNASGAINTFPAATTITDPASSSGLAFNPGPPNVSGTLTFQYLQPAPAPVPQSGTAIRAQLFHMATTLGSSDGFPTEARAFLWVAQCLWSLVLALVAGVTCSWLFRPAAA